MSKSKYHRTKTRKLMRALGTYKEEFEPIIEIYAGLKEQYDILFERFLDSDYKFSETSKNGTKKAPIVTTLESLRKDIMSYAQQLGLTPKGLLAINENAFTKKKESKIGMIFKGVDDG